MALLLHVFKKSLSVQILNFCTLARKNQAKCIPVINNTCTPNIPKMMKKVQQISTIFPMGFKEDRRVCTTSLRPGARLMTLNGLNARTSRKTRRIPKILDVCPKMITMLVSIRETMTRVPSMTFQPDLK